MRGIEEAYQAGYRRGCTEGYRKGFWDGVHGKQEEETSNEILEYPVRYLNISNRAEKCLRVHLQCSCIREALQLTELQIRCGRGIGRKTAEEVVNALQELGIDCLAWENCAYFL